MPNLPTIFTDNSGKSWNAQLTIGGVKRIKDLLGIDILAILSDQNLFVTLTSDIVTIVNLLYAIIKPQADEAQISDEEFGERLAGDCLGSALDAFQEGIINFFPPRKRALLKKALEKANYLEAETMRLGEKHLEERDLDAIIAAEFAKLSGTEDSTAI